MNFFELVVCIIFNRCPTDVKHLCAFLEKLKYPVMLLCDPSMSFTLAPHCLQALALVDTLGKWKNMDPHD